MSSISICILVASGDSDWSDWHFWVFIIVFGALYFAFNNWYAKNRRRKLSQIAPSMNFLWSDTMPETPRGIAFLQSGLGGEFSNAMTGSRAGCEVTIFDFEYETGISARTERTHAQTVAAFRSPYPILPAFQFGPETGMRTMSTVGSGEQFKIETTLSNVPAPIGHYVLRSTEPTAAPALFDSEVRKFFNGLELPHQPWFVEGNQEWLLTWQHNEIVSPQNYPWFLQQTSSIAATVFGYARLKHAATPQIAAGPVSAVVGQSVAGGAAPATATTGLTENLAGALAYVTIFPAIFFLVLEPYNKNPFVRFHAFQCIFWNIACLVLEFALMLIGYALGWPGSLILPVCLALIGLWIVVTFTAYQGRIFKLPVIGDWAERQANNA
ncbi:MAG: hypothetical protein WBQ43_23135 [Terriglobales bacterium]